MSARNFVLGLALGSCVLLAAAPGQAQRAANLSGRDIPPEERARDTMNRFAVCVVKARPNMVKSALAQASRAARIAALSNVAKRECLAGGMLRMDPVIFEGALYRALYLSDFGRTAPDVQALSAGEPVTTAFPTQVFGDCVVRTAPAETHSFIASAPSTPQEDAALTSLGSAFASCVPAEEQIRFSPAALQAALAEALYKRAAAVQSTTVATSAD